MTALRSLVSVPSVAASTRVCSGFRRCSAAKLWSLAVVAVLASGCGKLWEQMDKVDAAGSQSVAGSLGKQAPAVHATRVEVARVSRTSAELALTRPGEVEGSKEADVGSSMGGLVESVRIKVGSKVGTGSVLARIDTEMQKAHAELARIEVEDAEREYQRLKKLGSSVTSVRVDQAETRVSRAKAQYRVSSIQAERSVIRAPFGGVVTEVFVEKGEVAPPGGRVARVERLDPAIVSVSVSDRDLNGLSKGDTALILTAASGKPVEGKISRIEPTAGLKTRSFKVEIAVRNRKGLLKPGMIATVDFRRSIVGERVILPQDILVTRRDGNGVFIVGEGAHAQWRPLQLGSILGSQVVVESGLEAGEKVVVRGHRTLAHGDPLLIGREGRCCTNGRVTFGEGTGSHIVDGATAAVTGDAAPPQAAQLAAERKSAKVAKTRGTSAKAGVNRGASASGRSGGGAAK